MAKKITVSLPDELLQEIHGQLDYGDNRSEWIREAVVRRLIEEGVLDEGAIDEFELGNADLRTAAPTAN
jgi:metal-responsive CopG/Arc/MetJ family transcriptional regulator